LETSLGATPPFDPLPPLPAEPAPLRPRWHPLVRATLYLAAYFVAEVAVALLFQALAFALPDRSLRKGGFLQSTELLLVGVACQVPLTVAVTWLFVRFLDRRTLASLGARWPSGGPRTARRQLVTYSLGALALVGCWLLLIFALPAALASLHAGGVSAGYAAGGPSWWRPLPPALLLGVLLLLFLVQGGFEEWVVRGYIYRALKERWRPWWAALASSVLFSLLHAANPGVSALPLLNLVLAGLVFAALVERSGSLWGAAIAHGVWNFAIACLLSLPVSGVRLFHLLQVSVTGDETLTGGPFGPEGSLVLTAMGLALTAALWWRVPQGRPRNGIAPSAPEDVPPNAPP
jgi:membrane protease YdiL (CAAX protease family)